MKNLEEMLWKTETSSKQGEMPSDDELGLMWYNCLTMCCYIPERPVPPVVSGYWKC